MRKISANTGQRNVIRASDECNRSDVSMFGSDKENKEDTHHNIPSTSTMKCLISDEYDGYTSPDIFSSDDENGVLDKIIKSTSTVSIEETDSVTSVSSQFAYNISEKIIPQSSGTSGHLYLSSSDSAGTSSQAKQSTMLPLTQGRRRLNPITSESSDEELEEAGRSPSVSHEDNSLPSISTESSGSGLGHFSGRQYTSESSFEKNLRSEENSQAPNQSSHSPQTRRRSRNHRPAPNKWKRNVQKAKRNRGQSFTSKDKDNNEVHHPARRLKPPCQCRDMCGQRILRSERVKIGKAFWKLDTPSSRRESVAKLVTASTPKRRRLKNGRIRKRNTFKYHFKRGTELVRVCKTFFLNTLCIGEKFVTIAMRKAKRSVTGALSPDGRGRHVPANKTSLDITEAVKDHIRSLPLVDAHYCRKDCTKQCIEGTLNKTKVYDLYKEWCKEKSIQTVSQPVYERIFEGMNLRFHQPKKDQCWHIAFLRIPLDKRTVEDQAKFDLHMKRKQAAQEEKKRDKNAAAKDPTIKTIGMDMQAFLYAPLFFSSPLFYARKFAVNDFTIFDTKSKNGYCYVWGENEGRRGSQEVATCLKNFINTEVERDVKVLNIYADNCPGQNKNSIVVVALGHALQCHPSLEEINYKFLEPGHTYQEVDSIHAVIETAAKQERINEPNDWLRIIRGAKKSGTPYTVNKLTHNQFLNFKAMRDKCLGTNTRFVDGTAVDWRNSKWIKLKKQNRGSIYIKGEYWDDNFKRIAMRHFFSKSVPAVLYSSPLSISKKKFDDLMKLCTNFVIPEEYHSFYRSLPYHEDAGDTEEGTDGRGRTGNQ